MFKGDTCTLGNAEVGVFGENSFHTSSSKHQLWKIAKLGSAPSHDDATVDDVACEFRRSFLQNFFDRLDHLAELLGNSFDHFVRLELYGARKTEDEISPLHVHRKFFVHECCRTNLNLHILRHLVADDEVEILLYVVNYRYVHLVAGDLDRGRSH